MKLNLTIGWLYPQLMNIYGDLGNVSALRWRCQQRGIKLKVKNVSLKDKLIPNSFDLVFAGGGQDSQQIVVSQDLSTKKSALIQAARAGIPMLTICGSYQLFGRYFKPFRGQSLKGIGIFNRRGFDPGRFKKKYPQGHLANRFPERKWRH